MRQITNIMKRLLGPLMFFLMAISAYGQTLTCDLTGYKPMPGLSASAAKNSLTVIWDGDRGEELRLRFGTSAGSPVIQELAVRKRGAPWGILAANAAPDFRVVSGL